MLKRPSVNDANSKASRFRRSRFQLIEDLIEPLTKETGRLRVLDVGGRRDYWDLLSNRLAPKVSITILNNDSIEIDSYRRENDQIEVEYVLGDACDMPQYGNESFDLVHSNSVIEHVGSLQNMARMADEVRRVGRAYYVQTPYLWFPIEPHYGVPLFHWLPGPTRARLGWRNKIGYRSRMPSYRASLALADHTQMVDVTFMREMFPDGELRKERFFGLVKSLISLRPAALAD